ncbi:MAG TPA: hydrogenase maturation nickel metallochaperone HypA [Candidatus Xenobia bacterium]|jgi:hydrogenase nickel incorporation protein HypA/HybF
MHELGIMASTLDMAVEVAEQQGAARILSVRMRIGALAGVVPDALQFAFDVLAEGTLAEGGSLHIEPIPVRCQCATCEMEFSPPDLLCRCPSCGACSERIVAGRELELAGVEVEYAAA